LVQWFGFGFLAEAMPSPATIQGKIVRLSNIFAYEEFELYHILNVQIYGSRKLLHQWNKLCTE
jgi:hypothetical protein